MTRTSPTGPDSLVDSDRLDDPMDEGYSPPEKPRGVYAFGTTAAEQHQGESLEQRMAQEEPDPAAAFDDPSRARARSRTPDPA